jgi:hypothetical protein
MAEKNSSLCAADSGHQCVQLRVHIGDQASQMGSFWKALSVHKIIRLPRQRRVAELAGAVYLNQE